MTKLLLIASVVMLSACDNNISYVRDDDLLKCKLFCDGKPIYSLASVNNVIYCKCTSYEGNHLEYRQDGTIKTCEENK